MADCTPDIAGDFIGVCGYIPKQGNRRVFFVNISDIDGGSTQVSADGTQITALVLGGTAKAYQVSHRSETSNSLFSGEQGDRGEMRYTHTVELFPLLVAEEELETIQNFADGARVVAIVENVDSGPEKDLGWYIYGYEAGLKLETDEGDRSDNNGISTITMSSKEGEEEATRPKLWTEADKEGWLSTNLFERA